MISPFNSNGVNIDFDGVTLLDWFAGVKIDSIRFKYDSKEFKVEVGSVYSLQIEAYANFVKVIG